MSGRWVGFERTWHDTAIVNCVVCGRLIPRRAWVFTDGDREIQACSESCEELYLSYVKPTYETPEGEAE